MTLKTVARLTSRGRITIPLEIRNALGVGTGDRVEFENKAGRVHVRAASRSSRFAKYRGIGNPKIPSGRRAIITWLRRLRDR